VTERTDYPARGRDAGGSIRIRSKETSMLVHTLELADRRQLGRAIEELLGSDDLSDCAVEIDVLRIRFAASEERAAHVIRHLAQDGGLRAAIREWVDTGLVTGGGRDDRAKAL
jgi:hypothetical protein